MTTQNSSRRSPATTRRAPATRATQRIGLLPATSAAFQQAYRTFQFGMELYHANRGDLSVNTPAVTRVLRRYTSRRRRAAASGQPAAVR